MLQTKEKKKYRLFFILFCVLILGFLLSVRAADPGTLTFKGISPDVISLDTVWYSQDDSFQTDQLPAAFPCADDGSALLYTILPEDLPSEKNILFFRASQENVRIWLDGELLTETGIGDSQNPRILGKLPGSKWITVKLPSGFSGKKLQIELTSPYERYQGRLSTVYLGAKNGVIRYIYQTYGPGLTISVVLLILSFLMLLIYLLFFRSNYILDIGLFGLFASIWMIGESHMLQFFSSHLITWFYITVICMHLMPIPILAMIEHLPDFPYGRICQWGRRLMSIYLTILILLQICSFVDFMEILPLSQGILFGLCILIPVMVYWDFLHNKNRKILPTVAAVTVLCLFSCLEIMNSLTRTGAYLGNHIRLGVLAFFVIISIFCLRHSMQIYAEGLKSTYYKELSYSDQMTGCLNRRSCMEREAAWTPGGNDVVLMADLNDLKLINDSLGHHAGDTYIIACAKAMQEVFQDKGTCYRMGGDEFLFWGNHISQEELELLQQRFEHLVEETCRSIAPGCTVACGTAVYDPKTDSSIEETMQRADQRMYEKKRLIKAASKHSC